MVNFGLWAKAPHFAVEHAARLWAGIDPVYPFQLSPEQAEAVVPRQQMLVGAIAAGELAADHRGLAEATAEALNFSQSQIARADLIAFAKKMGERPAFLFPDAVLADLAPGRWCIIQAGVWIATQDLEMTDAVGRLIPDKTLKGAAITLQILGTQRGGRHWDLEAALVTLGRDAPRGGPVLYGRLGGQGDTIEAIAAEYWSSRSVRDDARGMIFARKQDDGSRWWDCLQLSAEAVQAFYPLARPEFEGPLVLQGQGKTTSASPLIKIPRNQQKYLDWLDSRGQRGAAKTQKLLAREYTAATGVQIDVRTIQRAHKAEAERRKAITDDK